MPPKGRAIDSFLKPAFWKSLGLGGGWRERPEAQIQRVQHRVRAQVAESLAGPQRGRERPLEALGERKRTGGWAEMILKVSERQFSPN